MILESIKGYLEANSIVPIYISFLPPSSGIAIYSMPSLPPDPKFHKEGGYQYHSIQITARFPDYSTCEAKLYQVYQAMESFTGLMGEYDVVDCRSNQAPYEIKLDESEDVHMQIVFYMETLRSSTYVDYTGYVINDGLIDWSLIINTPTTLSGYGITDGGSSGGGVPLSRTLTINGNAQDLSANRTWTVGDVFTTSSYINPSWLASLDYGKLLNAPQWGSGTVRYVGLSVPSIFSLAGNPITVSGIFTVSLATQAANTFFAGPSIGVDAVPTFRTITSDDLPAIPWGLITGEPTTLAGYGITDAVSNTRVLTINGLAQNLSADRTWSVGDVFTTSSYADPAWIVSLDWSKIVNEPTTTTGYGITDVFTKTQSDARYTPLTRAITINGLTQDLGADRIWSVGDVFTTSAYQNPSWLVTLDYGKLINVPPQSGQGTVTYVALAMPNIFAVSGSPITSSGLFDVTLVSQTQNRFFASPNGSNGLPSFRAIALDDIPSIPWSKITELPAFASGTVQYVGLIANPIFVVSGSPITQSGTFQLALSGQNQNTFLAAPSTANGIPVFRTIVLADLPDIPFSEITEKPTTLVGYGITDAVPSNRTITINGNSQDLSANRTWNVGDVFTTSAYNDPSWITALDWSKIVNEPAFGFGTVTSVGLATNPIFVISGSPVTTAGTLEIALSGQNQNTFLAAPSTAFGIPTFRTIVLSDLPSIPFSSIASTPTTLGGYGITDAYTKTEADNRFAPIQISGTIRYVGLSLPSIFSVQNSPLTGPGGTISGVLTTQASGLVFSGPASGSDAIPTFRTLVLADLPDIPFAALIDKPTTLGGYGITDAYTKTQSDQRYVPSGLYPPVSMYWSSSGSIYFVAHSGIVIGFPYQAGNGTLLYWKANAATPTIFTAFTTFPLIMTYNDILLVHASGVSIYKTATFPRLL